MRLILAALLYIRQEAWLAKGILLKNRELACHKICLSLIRKWVDCMRLLLTSWFEPIPALGTNEVRCRSFRPGACRTVWCWCLLIGALLASPAAALTLEQALILAQQYLPALKAAADQVRSSREMRQASLSPYFPSLDVTGTAEHNDTTLDRFDERSYDTILSYTLFDGGKRHSEHAVAGLNFDTDQEQYQKVLLDLELEVKSAFYNSLAAREIVQHRRLQLKDATKDHEVAQGRFDYGVAKRSDVLQASVRFEQARFSLIQAQGDFNKSLANLNSLIGRRLTTQFDLSGALVLPAGDIHLERLYEVAIARPVIKQAENQIEISRNQKAGVMSRFWPTVSATASYSQTKLGGSVASVFSREDKRVGVNARWNLFELGKFYENRAAGFDISSSKQQLLGIKRQVRIEVHNRHEDLITAKRNIPVAQQQLEEAEHNYTQALGEYQVGKGDILSLVQAERALAVVRELLTGSRLNMMLAVAQLERTVGIPSLGPYIGVQEASP